jgi:hypothetical protein
MMLSLMISCTSPSPDSGCELVSTVPSYVPACSAVLALFPEESRLLVDDRLEAYLPPDLQSGTVYGGASGNALTLLLDEMLGDARTTTVVFGDGLTSAHIEASFESGSVSGVVHPSLQD